MTCSVIVGISAVDRNEGGRSETCLGLGTAPLTLFQPPLAVSRHLWHTWSVWVLSCNLNVVPVSLQSYLLRRCWVMLGTRWYKVLGYLVEV